MSNQPVESDLFCDHCGYNLKTLDQHARCPECGHPVSDSTSREAVNERHDARKHRLINRILFLQACSPYLLGSLMFVTYGSTLRPFLRGFLRLVCVLCLLSSFLLPFVMLIALFLLIFRRYQLTRGQTWRALLLLLFSIIMLAWFVSWFFLTRGEFYTYYGWLFRWQPWCR